MENVSRALIIAGEVLIAVLVLSLAGVLIVKFGKFSSDMNGKLAENELNEFNNRFYGMSGRINITADEIASLLNFVKENNDSHDIDLINTQNAEYYADVIILDNTIYKGSFFGFVHRNYGDNISKTDFKNYINDFLKNYNNSFFYCNANVKNVKNDVINVKVKNEETDITKNRLGRVKEIKFGLTNNLVGVPNDYNVANMEKYKLVY